MYFYLKFIVYDKLLKPRQSFWITLYNHSTMINTNVCFKVLDCAYDSVYQFRSNILSVRGDSLQVLSLNICRSPTKYKNFSLVKFQSLVGAFSHCRGKHRITSSCLSVCPHVSYRLSLDGFSSKLIRQEIPCYCYKMMPSVNLFGFSQCGTLLPPPRQAHLKQKNVCHLFVTWVHGLW